MTNFIDLTADSDEDDQVKAKDQVSFQALAVVFAPKSFPFPHVLLFSNYQKRDFLGETFILIYWKIFLEIK